MIRLFSLSLLFTAASWSAASACSPSRLVRSGVQNYSAIDSVAGSGWHDPNLSIGLIYITQDSDGDLKSELIEVLKGDFEIDKNIWAEIATGKTADFESAMKNKPRGFTFWDRQDLGFTTMYIPGTPSTSCGPSPSRVILPENYYIQFKVGDRTRGFEIVQGQSDSFTKDIRDMGQGKTSAKTWLTTEDYLKNMDGFLEVEVESCPEDDRVNSRFGFGYASNTNEFDGGKMYNILDKEHSRTNGLQVQDQYAYRSRFSVSLHGKMPDDACVPAQSYLILEKRSSPRRRGPQFARFFVNPPTHRFLKIENGFINSEEIISKISITDPRHISVSDAKELIRTSLKHQTKNP